MSAPTDDTRLLFVLGCERSGSTWLANLLDAHPAVELLMEPFAPYAELVRDVPLRVPPRAPDLALVAALRAQLTRVPAHKYPLLYRRGRPVWLEAGDRAIAQALRRAAQRLRRPVPRWIERHELLGLHASEVPTRLRTRKTRAVGLRVVKELRLNHALPLLSQAFPEARFVAIARDPLAQIASIERWLARGHLRELAQALPRFRDAVAAPGPLHAYAPLLAGRDERVEVLCVYWIASYGHLLEDLARCGTQHRVLRHEALCAAPAERIRELLAFCGLDPAPQVMRYLGASSQRGAGAGTPLDTTRDTRRVPARALAGAPLALRARVLAVLDAARKRGLLVSALEALLDPPSAG